MVAYPKLISMSGVTVNFISFSFDFKTCVVMICAILSSGCLHVML